MQQLGDEGDRYLPSSSTPAEQEIRAAAGLASWLRHPRRARGFGGPMLLALGVLVIFLLVAIALDTL